jgi:hypothetical protein
VPSSADRDKPSAREAGKSVDDYVGSLSGWQREAVEALRALAREAAPGAGESIKWGQPVYEQNGPVAWMKAHASSVNFGFWRGAELDDPAGLLEGEGDRMRHVKVREGAALPAEELRRLIGEAVRLNQEKGDPTRRRR